MPKYKADPESLSSTLQVTIVTLDELQRMLAEAAQEVGYTRDTLLATEAYYTGLAASAEGDPMRSAIAGSALDFLGAYRDEVLALRRQTHVPLDRFRATAGSADWFAANTRAVSALAPVAGVADIPYQPNPFVTTGRTSYAKRFARLDPALGKTYQEIWEAFYGTRSDPERSALYVMRQSFDHLFACLAPDPDVRNSECWQPKEADQPNLVTRDERIQYAAVTYIEDPERRAVLTASSKQMLDTYRALNHAHQRGELDACVARDALQAMRRFMEEWADAVGL